MNEIEKLNKAKAALEKEIKEAKDKQIELAWKEEEILFGEYLLTLEDRESRLANILYGEEGLDMENVKLQVERLSKEKGNYYINSYWGNDGSQEIINEKTILSVVWDKLTSCHDDSYDFTIYDLRTGKAQNLRKLIEIKIK